VNFSHGGHQPIYPQHICINNPLAYFKLFTIGANPLENFKFADEWKPAGRSRKHSV
jgi:hypothetical protein